MNQLESSHLIQRNRYLDEIVSVLHKPIIKVLLGMRRVGKSTLLFQIQEYLKSTGVKDEQVISLNFELLEFEGLKNYNALNDYLNSKMTSHDKYYIFLDEVQEVEGFEKVVNSINAQGKAELFVTGSNSSLLSGELATYLTGRYYTIEVFPLSFSEIVAHQKTQNRPVTDIHSSFIDYLKMGGLPGRFMFTEERTAKNYIYDLYQSILLKDIVQRYRIRDVDLLQRFMLYLSNNVAQIFSADTVTKYLRSENRKLSRETIYNYIEAAQNAYLIYGVPQYDIRGKALMKTSEKYFIADQGLRGLFFDNEADIGQVLENIVFLELKRRGYDLFIGRIGDREIDFIAQDGPTTIYFQVAYLLEADTTIEREFSPLLDIQDNYPKYVLSMDPVNRSRQGVTHLNIIDFLLDDSLI
jgi:predicted AAA+ superfamily ATPase